MKQYLCLTLLACAPFSTAFSASTKTHQLPAQNIEVAPAHLTTRLNWSVFPKNRYMPMKTSSNVTARPLFVSQGMQKAQLPMQVLKKSTGVDQLDRILISAVKKAKVKPHLENGEAKAIIGYQAFNLRVKGKYA